MRILAVSDAPSNMLETRFDADYWREVGVELIVSCGDLSIDYLTYLSDAFRVPLAYVRGNHDATWEGRPGGDNIDGRVYRFGGVTFLGLEGSAEYNGGAVQYSESRMARKLTLLKPRLWLAKRVDVVVTHAAPRFCEEAYRRCEKPIGVGQRCPYIADPETGEPKLCLDASDHPHRGFACYRDFIFEQRPRFFLHGHRHRTYGLGRRELRIGETRVIDTFGHTVLDV